MRNLSIQTVTSNKTILKSSALVISVFIWSHLAQIHPQKVTVTLPVCFYGENIQELSLKAPETVTLTLQGKKRPLTQLDLSLLAVHIDVTTLREGSNGIIISHKHLFLPETISVIHYTPLPFVIVKQSKVV